MKRDEGFTLVELLLSMAFFSFVLLFVVVGFVQINRSYTRGLTTKEIQNSAREVIESISLAIRNADADSVEAYSTIPGNLRLCVGSIRFGWNMTDSAGNFTSETYGDTGNIFTLTRTSTGACLDPLNVGGGGSIGTQSLVADGIIVQHLSVQRLGTSNSFAITLVLSTDARANPSDFNAFGIDAACDVKTGDQYCDVARIDTVVTARN